MIKVIELLRHMLRLMRLKDLIGDGAKNQAAMNPTNTVYDAKRLIGRDFKDSVTQSEIKFTSYKVVEQNEKPHISG